MSVTFQKREKDNLQNDFSVDTFSFRVDYGWTKEQNVHFQKSREPLLFPMYCCSSVS